ncbi:MAG: hypothetical protein KJZ75_11445 [Hyphomonadaceae bacterium]|nr:hypothetical protein [Hyphomonadaceae bacterium]
MTREAREKAKITEGPWLIATSNSWRRVMSQRGEMVCEPIKQNDGHPDLHFRNGGPDGPDARLIAAAPDLANSIRPVVAAWEATLAAAPDEIEIDDDDTFVIRLTAAEWQAIRAALSKAEGASQ